MDAKKCDLCTDYYIKPPNLGVRKYDVIAKKNPRQRLDVCGPCYARIIVSGPKEVVIGKRRNHINKELGEKISGMLAEGLNPYFISARLEKEGEIITPSGIYKWVNSKKQTPEQAPVKKKRKYQPILQSSFKGQPFRPRVGEEERLVLDNAYMKKVRREEVRDVEKYTRCVYCGKPTLEGMDVCDNCESIKVSAGVIEK